jgi:DNA-binding LacI/PurR family transcriptional regulator
MRSLLTPDRPFGALFCFKDLLASGSMRALQQAGDRIPDDVTVTGFDDCDSGLLVLPSLTTIARDKVEIGRLAVSLLLGRIKGPRTGPLEHVAPSFHLVLRESTARVGNDEVWVEPHPGARPTRRTSRRTSHTARRVTS